MQMNNVLLLIFSLWFIILKHLQTMSVLGPIIKEADDSILFEISSEI